ncbi:hypothetical protein MMC09_002090 [Bachmanniomyces sp. S44760]|nr:hypothetical protein [Bachmanniomyces sp. S44760]
MNIIALLAVVAASFVMLVKTFIVSQFFFFDGISHVVTAALAISLIFTELPIFRQYFSRNWPLLSMTSGFVTLGILMIIVGCSILGNLNKQATSEQTLGVSFWRIVISSGIVCFILGVVNIFASFIFRTSSQGVTARMVRSYGAVAPHKVDDIVRRASTTRRRSFHLGRSDTLPSYATAHTSPNSRTMAETPASRQQRQSSAPGRMGLNISAPVAADQEQFAKFKASGDVQRPDTAFHPAYASHYGGPGMI